MKIAKNTKRIMIVFLRKRRIQMYHEKKKGMGHGGRAEARMGTASSRFKRAAGISQEKNPATRPGRMPPRRRAMYGSKQTMRHGGAAHGSQPSYGNTVDTAMPKGSAV
jgi:hypothetical protein